MVKYDYAITLRIQSIDSSCKSVAIVMHNEALEKLGELEEYTAYSMVMQNMT